MVIVVWNRKGRSVKRTGKVHNKSLTVQAQGWKRHYSTPFWNGLLFLTQMPSETRVPDGIFIGLLPVVAYFDSCLFVAGGVAVFAVSGMKFGVPAFVSGVDLQGMQCAVGGLLQ